MTIRNIEDDSIIRYEKVCTFREFIEMGRVQVGMGIYLSNLGKGSDGIEYSQNSDYILIGDYTPAGPSYSTGSWDNYPHLDKYVLEVYISRGNEKKCR